MQDSQVNFDEKLPLPLFHAFFSRPKGKKGKGKKKGSDESESDFDLDTSDIGPARDRPGTLFKYRDGLVRLFSFRLIIVRERLFC